MTRCLTPSRILMAGFFLVPLWYFFPSISLEMIPRQGQFVMMMAVAVLALAFYSRNWWVRAFCLYAVAWVMFAQMATMYNVCAENIMAATAARDFLRHLLVGVGIYAVVVKSDVDLDTWADWVCAAAVFQMIIGIPQVFGYFPETAFLNAIGLDAIATMKDFATGLLENANFFSGYLAISAPFFLRGRWKWWLPLLVGHVLLSHTSTAVAALAAGAFVYFQGQWFLLAGVGVAGALYVWFDGSAFNSSRWEFWREMVTGFRWSSWFNVSFGFGPYARWMHPWHPHNEYVKLWWDFGPPGLLMAGGYLWSLRGVNRMLLAALVAAAVDCLGSFPFHLPPSAYLIIVIMALIEKERSK